MIIPKAEKDIINDVDGGIFAESVLGFGIKLVIEYFLNHSGANSAVVFSCSKYFQEFQGS